MDDLISRSAVLEILNNEFNMAEQERSESEGEEEMAFNSGEMNCARRSLSKVMNLPAIDAVPVVHGHWIKVIGGNGLVSTIRCSECDNCDNPSYIPGNYCWFCGAKMDGEENAAD